MVSADVAHVCNAPGQNTAECASKACGAEEQSNTIMLFGALVPHAQVEHDSREEPGFRRGQKEAGDEQPGEALSEAHQGANDAPREGESWEPEPWSREFEDNVTWDLEQGVTNKVNGQCGKELVSGLFSMVM